MIKIPYNPRTFFNDVKANQDEKGGMVFLLPIGAGNDFFTNAGALPEDIRKKIKIQRTNKMPKIELEVVEAPGDRCGNTKKLPDGSKCPGCRACC